MQMPPKIQDPLHGKYHNNIMTADDDDDDDDDSIINALVTENSITGNH
jgi:hypothetical protein